MSQTIEPQVQWSQSEMVEIVLNEPDDFESKRDSHTYWCRLLGKKRNFTNLAIFLNKQG